LQELETKYREAKAAHDRARRRLEVARRAPDMDLQSCWEVYCESIFSLDAVTSELERFRGNAIHIFSS